LLPQKTVATRAGYATLVSARHSQKTGDIISSMRKLALILFFFISPLFAQEVQRPPEIIAQCNHAVKEFNEARQRKAEEAKTDREKTAK
jgi:hypothetical protein